MTIRGWFRRKMDPAQYCKTCGRECAVDVAAIYDRQTGMIAKLRWGVGCPQIGMIFAGPRGWKANGYTSDHYYDAYALEPTWLDPRIRALIVGKADDSGYLGEGTVPSVRIANGVAVT